MPWKKSTRFPFIKRTKTKPVHQTKNALSSVMNTSAKMVDSIATQLAKPLDDTTRTKHPAVVWRMLRGKQHPTTISVVARVVKYTVVLLLIIAVVVSAVYLTLYTRDYVSEKHRRNPIEIIRAAVLLAISIALLVFANSHWHAISPLSIPLSVSIR